MPGFVRDSEFLPPFLPPTGNNTAAAGGGHPLPETVLVLSFPVGWLKCSLHDNDCLSVQK